MRLVPSTPTHQQESANLAFSEHKDSETQRSIKCFSQDALIGWADTELAKLYGQSPHLLIRIGEVRFKLQKTVNIQSEYPYAWQQLQGFKTNVDFLARFSPIIDIKIPKIACLYIRLLGLIDFKHPEIVLIAHRYSLSVF